MESLKQFRVSYKVTYHCWGYKGIFRREAYRFSVTFYNDPMETLSYINARTEKEAIEIAETYIKKHIERYVEQSEKNQETGDYMILAGILLPMENSKCQIKSILSLDMNMNLFLVKWFAIGQKKELKERLKSLLWNNSSKFLMKFQPRFSNKEGRF